VDTYTEEIKNHPSFAEFAAYHESNPSTYEFFKDIALRARLEKGYKKGAINHLMEIGRWERGRDFSLASGFQHTFRALYTRLLMHREPELEGFFEVRAVRQAA
jgi:hypothetical protein